MIARGPHRRARLVFAIATGALATAATTASAAAAPQPARGRVLLDVAACPDVPETAIRRIIGIEIGDLLLEPGAATPTDADRLSVRCAGAGSAWLQARGVAGDPIDRTLRLTDFPGDAAPRAVALAGIEMLAALSPAVRERLQARQVAPAPAPPPAGRRTAVSASAVRRDFLGTNGFGGWGGRADVERAIGARWLATAGLEIDGGGVSIALGDASALLISLGGFWGLHAAGGRIAGSLSAGARVGLAHLEGTPAGGSGVSGASALRPWWGPAIAARGAFAAGAIGFVVSLEAGFTVRGAEALAGGATVLAVNGAWLTGGVGLRF